MGFVLLKKTLTQNIAVMATDILLIGTGITGALSAFHLKNSMPSVNISLWDEACGAGGRMSGSISPSDSNCAADIGAQYITTNMKTMTKYKDIYEPLIRDGIIEGLTVTVLGMKKFEDESIRHFVAPRGMNSIVKYFLKDVPSRDVRFNTRVIAIDEEGGKLTVESEEGFGSFHAVVSTMPVPQFLQLSGSVPRHAADLTDLQNVAYSSRFALVLFFAKDAQFPFPEWGCRYLDHPVFRYVSVDNVKRNRPEDPVSVMFHTSVKFGVENLEKTLPEMEKLLLGQARELFPDWPEPAAVKCHKWRFSQVVEPFPGKPGCLMLNPSPVLVLGGDAFSESNFDGCIHSSLKIVEALRESFP
ncbi:UNVERIFIED_CONTAM: hypothetical protein PYX00_004100 [Menopon gallinae]|uniref:Amine oxidase domain-containing protein n=1 Tax=Menopon gallinae TaxID=328185 RepID=A0AAW2I4B3_9NEOP